MCVCVCVLALLKKVMPLAAESSREDEAEVPELGIGRDLHSSVDPGNLMGQDSDPVADQGSC